MPMGRVMCTSLILSTITPTTQMELWTSGTIPGMQKPEKRE
jgi:hypothetical protein